MKKPSLSRAILATLALVLLTGGALGRGAWLRWMSGTWSEDTIVVELVPRPRHSRTIGRA